MATDSKPRILILTLEDHELKQAVANFAEGEFPHMSAGVVTINGQQAYVELSARPTPIQPEPVKRTRKTKGAA